jgi:ABC-type polysaccharide/polyol phosphate export permease
MAKLMTYANGYSAAIAALGIVRDRLALALYLAKMQLKMRYAGTSGGALWMFLGPLLTIFTIWIALDVGLSATGRFGSDFGVAFAVGLSAWLFFTDVVQTAVGSITSNAHLVKKVVFPVWVLPLSIALAGLAVHLVVLLAVFMSLYVSGTPVSPRMYALPFWIACMLGLAFAVSLLLASLNVRSRDTSLITPNVIALAFWLTPIVWPLKQIPETWRSLVLLNPAAVIVEGYRSALGVGDNGLQLLDGVGFILVTAAICAISALTYRKYRTAFADSL